MKPEKFKIMSWSIDFKENALYRIDENTRMIAIAFKKLEAYYIRNDSEDLTLNVLLWKRPNDSSNSLGNQLLHLCGNMTQYIISSLGEQEDLRERDVEFSATEGFAVDELLTELHETVSKVKTTIHNTTEAQLLKKRDVQGFNFSGMGCVIHATEHYSYHTGQIAFWVKQLTNEPLGFYDGMDLTIKNKA